MLPAPQAVMSDDENGERLSRSKDWRAALTWLDRTRPILTERAYLAYRGSHVARMAADSGNRAAALRYYGAALARGAFSPVLAAKAFGQILIPASIYRRLRK
jgi:hypothetical protein